jgi:hypothetical protein
MAVRCWNCASEHHPNAWSCRSCGANLKDGPGSAFKTAQFEPIEEGQGLGALVSLAGFGPAILSIFLFPVLFGPLGILLGFIGLKLGSSLGKATIGLSAVSMIIGMIYGAIVWSSFW